MDLPIDPTHRPLHRRCAQTLEGEQTLRKARALSRDPEFAHMSDGELIRLAYWGASGERDDRETFRETIEADWAEMQERSMRNRAAKALRAMARAIGRALR